MKQKQKLIALVGLMVLFLVPGFYLRAENQIIPTELPNFGEVPRDEVIVENIVSEQQPLILRDSVFYLKVNNGYPALFKKNLTDGQTAKIADRVASGISYEYNYNTYNNEGVEVGNKILFYSRFTDETNEYDLYAYNLRNSTEYLILSKVGNQLNPKGTFDGFSANIIYSDIINENSKNIAKAYSNFDNGTDETLVSNIPLEADYAIKPGASFFYYESGSDIKLFDVYDVSETVFLENSSDPQVPSIDEILYTKTNNGNKDIYFKNLSINREYVVADSLVNETNPQKSLTGDISYIEETQTGHKIVTKRNIYGNDSRTFEAFAVSNSTYSENSAQHSFSGHFVWIGTKNGQSDLLSFDSGLLNRYNVKKAGDYTFWFDGFDWAGPRLNSYNSVTKTKKVIEVPQGGYFDYYFYCSEGRLAITVKTHFTPENPARNYIYLYNFETETLENLTPANQSRVYSIYGITKDNLLFYEAEMNGFSFVSGELKLMNLTNNSVSALTEISELASVEAFEGNYISFMESPTENTYNLKILNISNNELTTIIENATVPSGGNRIFFTNSYIKDNKVIWTDGIDIFVYDINSKTTETIKVQSGEGVLKYNPKIENGIIVWQEAKPEQNGGMIGLSKSVNNLFGINKAFAAVNDKIITYSLGSKEILSILATNSETSQVKTYLASNTLYYDDISSTGFKNIYAATLIDRQDSSLVNRLPKTGVAILELFTIGAIGGCIYSFVTKPKKKIRDY